jgi:PleD family two-component response regulator
VEQLLSKAAAAKLGTCRVIIISGNKFTCQLVRAVLPSIGIADISVSHEPGDAEHQLTISRFDLIIVDAGPAAGFDWLALVEMVRTLPDKRQAETPAVLLVSNPTKELIERAKPIHIRNVVAKPFTAGVLNGHVKCALGIADYCPSPSLAHLAIREEKPDLLV